MSRYFFTFFNKNKNTTLVLKLLAYMLNLYYCVHNTISRGIIMLKITRACDYTIRALIFMAKKPTGTAFMRSDIAKECDVPDSFLGKILQSLAKSDILLSERGKKGGFKLGKEPKDINMHDVLIAVDGPLNINNCLEDPLTCGHASSCLAHNMWNDVQDDLIKKLKKYTLADISN